jgi:hypothetical protein
VHVVDVVVVLEGVDEPHELVATSSSMGTRVLG